MIKVDTINRTKKMWHDFSKAEYRDMEDCAGSKLARGKSGFSGVQAGKY